MKSVFPSIIFANKVLSLFYSAFISEQTIWGILIAIFDYQLNSNRKKAKKKPENFLNFLKLRVNNSHKCDHYTTGDNSNEQNM